MVLDFTLSCVPAEQFFKAVGVRGYKFGGEHRLGGEAVTAHPKYDPDTGRLICSLLIVSETTRENAQCSGNAGSSAC